MDIDEIDPAPWKRGAWSGRLLSADGTDTTDFARPDVIRVVAWGEEGLGKP